MSEAACAQQWIAVDADANGVLTEQEDTSGYLKLLATRGTGTIRGGTLTRQEFLTFCLNGVFAGPTNVGAGSPPNAPAAPATGSLQDERENKAGGRGKGDITPGAAPIPLEEAEKRVRASGFRPTGPLILDAENIWRGKVWANGKEVDIAVDPQGDIATQNKR